MIGDCGIRGLLELFILVECKSRPSSGKDITQKASKLSDNLWKPSAGSTYPLLQKMEKEGLIKSTLKKQEKGRREIAYAITKKGKQALDAGRSNLEKSTDAMMTALNPILIRIMQEFDDEEIQEAKQFWNAMMDIRKLALAEPNQAVRHKKLIRVFKIAIKAMESMKVEAGLKK
jgi:DNA-binding PadR family transcriptional regulator